jgi:hypothetical protein
LIQGTKLLQLASIQQLIDLLRMNCADAKERVPTLVGQPLLPINNRVAKDSRAKDEKPMNGNSENHSSDWV